MLNKLSKLKIILFFVFALIVMSGTVPVSAQDSLMPMESHSPMRMFTTVRILKNGAPLPKADVVLSTQSRTTDEQGFATFEDVPPGSYTVKIYYNGTTYTNNLKIQGTTLTVDVAKSGLLSLDSGLMMLSVLIAAALIIALAIYGNSQAKIQNMRTNNGKTRKLAFGALVFVLVLAFILTIATYQSSIIASLFSANKANQSLAAELTSIPQPQNVRIVADDRVATIYWDPVSDSSVVGYVVKWGKESVGSFTDMKQTIHPITQIQPLENGTKYIVQVQSVQGSYTYKPTSSEQGGNDKYAVANGNLSLPVVMSVTPTSARVEAMRSRLTGFFDDMNISAGGFDETKWNHASTACAAVGEDGQFINSQFHGHNQTKSDCDRDGNVARPRAIFDISGRTETNPGQIEFDMDGVSQPRDVWYVDLIPADARKNGLPLDVTSHNDLFDADHEDPGRMIRISQYYDKVVFHYYDANNQPHAMTLSKLACSTWDGAASMQDCAIAGKQTAGFSPIAEISAPLTVTPNVRRHWVIQVSPQKIKLFVDSTLMAEAVTPTMFANITKYQIHSTLFSYNTGKQYNGIIGPTTSMLHWDNFGFNGPAPTTVTHNYLDGGPTGTTPMIATGTVANPVPGGNRTTKIPIPDPIGTPIGKARLMFTVQPFSSTTWNWSSGQNVVINGKTYPYSDPKLNIQSTNITEVAGTYTAHSDGMYIDPADLVQGMNQVTFNIGTDILNVHLELDYDKNNAPTFTQPRDLFANLTSYISPAMRSNDMYWFIEQKMGLETGTTPGATLPPASSTPAPATPVPTIANRSLPPSATPVSTPIPTSVPTRTPVASSTTGSKITIYAAGIAAKGVFPTLVLNLNLNGTRTNVATFTNVNGNPSTGQFNAYTYNANSKVLPGQVRVRFTNDFYSSSTGEDRNVRVNRINIDGQDFPTVDPGVLSTGTWTTASGCAAGYKQSEWLMCNGYFQYK